MNNFYYIGVMVATVEADRFLTSIFKDDHGNFFTQEDEDEKIIGFKSISLTRDIHHAEKMIPVQKNQDKIYSFMTVNKLLISGNRHEIEEKLLPLLYGFELTDQAKLMLSSFFKFYQKTIDLIAANQDELRNNGITSHINSEAAFRTAKEQSPDPKILLENIKRRCLRLKKQEDRVRIEDVVYLNQERAYFTNQSLSIDALANDVALQNESYNKIVSELITVRVEDDRNILKSILYDNLEAYYFVLYSEYINLEQWQVESFLSLKKSRENNYRDIFDIGKDLDSRIHGAAIIPPLMEETDTVDDGSIDQSFEEIITSNTY
ncbi:hypothetical protein LX99_02864 [Mucilaginibacter oryzae]|uniref:Uncharacterized protein n=1 Tax=Mucilaginibacter oryzae TaxID=468058 RepID=A0A316H7U4_9SPHI|nr:hypothetical protein [Mucilaginibacter oryzae]PWK77054.1 hypothetical protein LX99_02864 [Mucilaginibacter oryzae]